MKKLIYSLAIALIGMTSCNSFDEEHSQTYGDGPAVSINLTTTADSTFAFTVNPAEGTGFYSYMVIPGKVNTSLTQEAILKNTPKTAISQGVIEYAKYASVSDDMRDDKNQPLCLPNTTYTIYAVAASTNGVMGKLTTLEVTTTDGEAPVMEPYEAKDPTDENDTITTVSFSEDVVRGEGAVTAAYYQEWGDGSLITIPAEDIKVTVSGNKVSFAVSNVPAGAFVLYSWGEGAFVDSFGNKCPATNTQITDEGISGVYKRLPTKDWSILDSNLAPESGSLVDNYKTFQGTMTFDHDIFRDDELVATGDISVVYASSTKTSTIALKPSQWSVSGKVLTFTLPEEPAAGDIITVKVKAGVIFDVNGNSNKAYTSTSKTVWWKYFAMTKDMAIGNFDFKVTMSSGKTYNFGTVTIEEDPEEENGLIIKNLYLDGSVVGGRYDLNAGKIYIGAYYELGITTISGTEYGLLTYSLTGQDEIAFTVNPDGTMESSDFAIVACDTAYNEIQGWYIKALKATFSPVSSAAKGKTFSAKKVAKKSSKKAGMRKVSLKGNRRSLKTIIK